MNETFVVATLGSPRDAKVANLRFLLKNMQAETGKLSITLGMTPSRELCERTHPSCEILFEDGAWPTSQLFTSLLTTTGETDRASEQASRRPDSAAERLATANRMIYFGVVLFYVCRYLELRTITTGSADGTKPNPTRQRAPLDYISVLDNRARNNDQQRNAHPPETKFRSTWCRGFAWDVH